MSDNEKVTTAENSSNSDADHLFDPDAGLSDAERAAEVGSNPPFSVLLLLLLLASDADSLVLVSCCTDFLPPPPSSRTVVSSGSSI